MDISEIKSVILGEVSEKTIDGLTESDVTFLSERIKTVALRLAVDEDSAKRIARAVLLDLSLDTTVNHGIRMKAASEILGSGQENVGSGTITVNIGGVDMNNLKRSWEHPSNQLKEREVSGTILDVSRVSE